MSSWSLLLWVLGATLFVAALGWITLLLAVRYGLWRPPPWRRTPQD